MAVEQARREEEEQVQVQVRLAEEAWMQAKEQVQVREKEERVASPPRSKGKGWVPVQELDLGEVIGVICDLCEKKGIPYR